LRFGDGVTTSSHEADIAPLSRSRWLLPQAVDSAQAYLPGGSALDAPLPPPLPEPKIAPPVVPKMDAPPRQNYAPPSTRPSFSDRITGCLQEGSAAGPRFWRSRSLLANLCQPIMLSS
jgi:hypothetical protein